MLTNDVRDGSDGRAKVGRSARLMRIKTGSTAQSGPITVLKIRLVFRVVVPGRPWPEAAKQARSRKSNDLLLWRADQNVGEATLPFIARTSVIMERYRKDVIYSETHVCDPGTNRSSAFSPSGSSLRTRVRRSTG